MSTTLMNIESQISLISLAEQISLMAYLANAIKLNSEAISGEKAIIEDNEISHRLSLLSGLQKYRGRLGDDFYAENELAEARSLKYGK